MSDLAIIQQNKITELRGSLMDALEFTEVQQARIKELEDALATSQRGLFAARVVIKELENKDD